MSRQRNDIELSAVKKVIALSSADVNNVISNMFIDFSSEIRLIHILITYMFNLIKKHSGNSHNTTQMFGTES